MDLSGPGIDVKLKERKKESKMLEVFLFPNEKLTGFLFLGKILPKV
jgi:hypothetical protein